MTTTDRKEAESVASATIGRGEAWDPSFFLRSPLFWPIARAARVLGERRGWPQPDDLTRLFEGVPPVRFEPAAPRRRRGHPPAEARYDARIALARRVPTRAQSWHDVHNALVWATFPNAKLALHARQHALVAARLGPDLRLPGARTPEQDALAMFDEGGVALLCRRARSPEVRAAIAGDAIDELRGLFGDGSATAMVFGHAIYESLASGRSAGLRALARIIEVEVLDPTARGRIRAADDAIAVLLSRAAPLGREDFVSLAIDERLPATWTHQLGADAAAAR